jgi:hypothetical protein
MKNLCIASDPIEIRTKSISSVKMAAATPIVEESSTVRMYYNKEFYCNVYTRISPSPPSNSEILYTWELLISDSAQLPSKQKHFEHFNGNNLVIITDPISPDTHKWPALLNTLLNLRVPYKAANDKMSHYQLSKRVLFSWVS